jgi:hypothetical protein
VAPDRAGVDRPGADRAQERCLVGQPHRRVALGHDGDRRAGRRERLGDRSEDAAVHEPERLAQLVAHRQACGHVLVGDLQQLEAEQLVQADGVGEQRLLVHVKRG